MILFHEVHWSFWLQLLLKLGSDLGRKLTLEFPISMDLQVMKVHHGFLFVFYFIFFHLDLEKNPGIYLEVKKKGDEEGRRRKE